jgi:hypothetical protein
MYHKLPALVCCVQSVAMAAILNSLGIKHKYYSPQMVVGIPNAFALTKAGYQVLASTHAHPNRAARPLRITFYPVYWLFLLH